MVAALLGADWDALHPMKQVDASSSRSAGHPYRQPGLDMTVLQRE